MLHIRSLLLSLLFLTALSVHTAIAFEVPPLTGRVNDLAGMLTPETRTSLEQKLAAFEQETSNQVVVLTIKSLDGENIDTVAIRVAEAWKPGQKEKDNGVLLILAKAERKVRIEVGMGLQGALPDITASRIIREIMRPYLKTNDFDRGISVGVESIMAATRGEFKAPPAQPRQHHKKSGGAGTFLLVFLLTIIAAFFIGAKSRPLSTITGGIGMPLAGIAAFTGISMTSIALLAAAGLVAGYLISLVSSGMTFGGGGGGGGGGFYGGGWGGGFSGGGSSDSGDSFSGGGGDFDGGGSSDDY